MHVNYFLRWIHKQYLFIWETALPGGRNGLGYINNRNEVQEDSPLRYDGGVPEVSVGITIYSLITHEERRPSYCRGSRVHKKLIHTVLH
jgi:hypothetical protein